MDLYELQDTYKLPNFKSLLDTAREIGFTDDRIASIINVFFGSHENQILRSLSQTISYQQVVINTLVDVEKKDEFIKYINDCINRGLDPHELRITDWDGFFTDYENLVLSKMQEGA